MSAFGGPAGESRAGPPTGDWIFSGLEYMRALVVDDSKTVRMILGRTLRELGYEVEEAVDGEDALDRLNERPGYFEVALLDWNMPQMNGMEVLKRVRADERHSSLVILMVTTETEVEHMAEALEAGANEYVMKPFTKDILIEKLELTRMHF